MKKLIIAAALVLGFAGMSQASVFNWKLADTDDSQANWIDQFAGENVYIISAADWNLLAGTQTRTLENLTAGAEVQQLNGNAKYATIEYSSALGNSTGPQSWSDGGADIATTADYFALIANDDGYILIDMSDAVGATTTDQDPPMNNITGEDVMGAWAAQGGAFAAWDAAAPVPEPTSGLLLLLGVAGLALKRKRA